MVSDYVLVLRREEGRDANLHDANPASLSDLGFDFTEDYEDYHTHDTPFPEQDNTATQLPAAGQQGSERETATDTAETEKNQGSVALINGATLVTSVDDHPKHENNEDSRVRQETENVTEEQLDSRKEARITESETPTAQKEPTNGFEAPPAYSEEYRRADEFPEPSPPEGFNTESLLQVMSEEVTADELEDELIMDESLTPLERIYMFNKSDMMIHRLLVAKELPNTIYEISVSEAVNYVLPIVLKIGTDPDDTVRETFVSELDKIIMYYYKNAPPVVDRTSQNQKQPMSQDIQQESSSLISAVASLHMDNEELDTISVPAPTEDAVAETSIDENEGRAETIGDDSEDKSEEKHIAEEQKDDSDTRISDSHPQSTSETATEHQDASGGVDLHIPQHVFAPLLIEFLLDQNSNLASLGQQCIVSVATELVSAKGTKDEELFKTLLETEIFDGIVLGLVSIIEGRQHPHDYEQRENEHGERDESIGVVGSGFDETGGFMSHSSADELDQGAINLAKMMCLSVISALTTVLGPERCSKMCLPIVESMANDQMFYVRKEAAAAVGSLATVVDRQVAIDRLLPLYTSFARDTIWHVRRSCVLALPLLCGVLPEDIRTQIAVDGVKLFKNDVSRNVRNTLAEVIGELIAKFLPEDWETTGKPGKVPEPLLEFFLSLGPSSSSNQMYKLETDRAIICAYNFPAVVLTAGADYWDSHLKDTYLSLTKDYQIKVRRTFAYSLHEIARIIGPERTERDLVQIFALYLMDLDDVKQGVLEHLAEFLGTLAVSSRNEYIPILAEVWDGVATNWRLRDILAGQLRDIAMLFDAARVVEHILPLAIRACHDDYAAVRETGVESFPVILEIVKRAVDEDGETLSQTDPDIEDSADSRRELALALLNHVMEKLDELVRSRSYRRRLIFVQICKLLLEAGICAGDFASFFLPRLIPLAEDPIVNVRIATSRTIRAIQTHDTYRAELSELVLTDTLGENESQPGQILEQLLYQLALDKDADVRSFVIDLVDPQRLNECKQEMERHLSERQQQEDAGTPMQGIEHPSSSLSGSQSSSVSHHDDETRAETQEVQSTDIPEDDDASPAGTPMDFSTEDDHVESEAQEVVDHPKHDEDGDATMTEATYDDEKDFPERTPSPTEDEKMFSPSPMPQEPVPDVSPEDKEKDEYVYLSKSMVHQEDDPHATSSSAVTSQSHSEDSKDNA